MPAAVGFTPETATRILDLVNSPEDVATRRGTGRRATVDAYYVALTSLTQTEGRYPGVRYSYTAHDDVWTAEDDVWVVEVNGDTPALDTKYPAIRSAFADGRQVWLISACDCGCVDVDTIGGSVEYTLANDYNEPVTPLSTTWTSPPCETVVTIETWGMGENGFGFDSGGNEGDGRAGDYARSVFTVPASTVCAIAIDADETSFTDGTDIVSAMGGRGGGVTDGDVTFSGGVAGTPPTVDVGAGGGGSPWPDSDGEDGDAPDGGNGHGVGGLGGIRGGNEAGQPGGFPGGGGGSAIETLLDPAFQGLAGTGGAGLCGLAGGRAQRRSTVRPGR